MVSGLTPAHTTDASALLARHQQFHRKEHHQAVCNLREVGCVGGLFFPPFCAPKMKQTQKRPSARTFLRAIFFRMFPDGRLDSVTPSVLGEITDACEASFEFLGFASRYNARCGARYGLSRLCCSFFIFVSSFFVASGSYAAAFEAPDEKGVVCIKPKRSLTLRMVVELEQAEILLQGRGLPPELERLFCPSRCDMHNDTPGKVECSSDEVDAWGMSTEPLGKKAKCAEQWPSQQDTDCPLSAAKLPDANSNAEMVSNTRESCIRASIVVLCNDGSDGLSYPLEKDLVVFGRDSSCDVCIGRKTVSGKHAQLRRGYDGHWTLKHIGHGNPTLLNGRCILYSPAPIEHGDIFTISKRRFRFETLGHSPNW
jgi:hypothetical protein